MLRFAVLQAQRSRCPRTATLAVLSRAAALSQKPDFNAEKNEKYFDHDRLEANIYKWWEDSDFFVPKDRSGRHGSLKEMPFVVPMPPPNVTGYLHMGHALFASLQDAIVRFQRMRGRETLWLPGTDHAGIATQLLVEKELASVGLSRQEIGRDAFVKRVWEWKSDKGGTITQQLRRLGASADWSRERFTLEADMNAAVNEAFIRLYEKGMIYRGDYMVNWSPSLQTAVSDLEVDYGNEKGDLYYFKYYLVGLNNSSVDKNDFIPIATTRLETVFGDAALCVHPNDERYKHLIGRSAYVPMSNRQIPIIGDEYVDTEFGTGALKITPAHDVNDHIIGKAHGLDSINIFNKDGTMNDVAGSQYAGACRFECRQRVWDAMLIDGSAIRKETVEAMRVPRSQRGGEVIEPMLSTQWFVRTQSMREKAIKVVENGSMSILPARFEKVWHQWLEVDKDWCISRQLWWGHRIPVYYRVDGGPQDFIVARSDGDALELARKRWGDAVEIKQDDDVLDTWFSSGLWPFATVGWPGGEEAHSGEYQKYFPATLLETGYDILFFWVARMVMMSLELTGKAPFDTVYMHGLVKDQQGNKMSKTRGNVIDPVVSIKSHGCDALRLSLLSGTTPGMDISLSETKIETNRNFVNKLWNVGKYVMHTKDLIKFEVIPRFHFSRLEITQLPLLERFIIARAHSVSIGVTNALNEYKFAEASRDITDFVWNELADWFIEASKSRLKPGLLSSKDTPLSDICSGPENSTNFSGVSLSVLLYVWQLSLKLLHPFMPFVTESLWQMLSDSEADSLMISEWPVVKGKDDLYVDKEAIADFEILKSIVKAIRNTRTEYAVSPSKRIAATINVQSHRLSESLQTEILSLSFLGRLDSSSIQFVNLPERVISDEIDKTFVQLVISEGVIVFLPISDLVDVEKETARLQRQIEKIGAETAILQNRLQAKKFVDRAKPEVVAATRAQLLEKEDVLSALHASLARLSISKSY